MRFYVKKYLCFAIMVFKPGWRNRQTRSVQNAVPVRDWEFESPPGHEIVLNKILKYLTKPLFVFLGIGIAVSFIIAILSIPSQLYFYFDQARDAYEAYGIFHGDFIKLLGPGTDIPNLYSGVIWYYFLSILYKVSNYNPVLVAGLLTTIIFATLPAAYTLTYKLFKDKLVAVVSVILYVFSPLFQLATRWMSNPLLSFIITPIFLLSLWMYLEKPTKKLGFISGFLFGILIQSTLGYILFIFLLPVYLFAFKVKNKVLTFLIFSLGFILSLSTFILSEVKFEGKGIMGVIKFVQTPHSSIINLFDYPMAVVNKYLELLSTTIIPVPFLGILLVLAIILSSIFLSKQNRSLFVKNKMPLLFLIIWVLNIIIFRFFQTGISNSWFVFLPTILPLAILAGFILVKLIKNKMALILLLLIIISGQIYTNFNWIKESKNLFSSQDRTTYKIEQEIVDYTYRSSNGKPFSISTITVPLYINTTWDYLYSFYGNYTYGYAPSWDGRDQKGYLGKLQKKNDVTKYRYLIIEPQVPVKFIFDESLNEDNISVVVERKKIKDYIIEKRISKKF